MSERLQTWTRTLNEDDALRLLDEAEPGLTLGEWSERGHERLPQAGRDRRTELIRLVRDRLIDWNPDQTVADTRWLALARSAPPGARLDLLHGRYLFDHPWILRAHAELITPHLAASEAALADRDADLIPHATWAAFVAATAADGTGPTALEKTRSVLLRNLERLGVIRREGPRSEHARVVRGLPAPVAFGWLVAYELRVHGMSEATVRWATRSSRAALLFRPEEPYADRCLDGAITAGLLRRSFIAGEARVLLGET